MKREGTCGAEEVKEELLQIRKQEVTEGGGKRAESDLPEEGTGSPILSILALYAMEVRRQRAPYPEIQ